MNPTALERALELAPDPEGRLVGSIPEGWRVAVGVHGGLVTALLGGPFFLYLLMRGRA